MKPSNFQHGHIRKARFVRCFLLLVLSGLGALPSTGSPREQDGQERTFTRLTRTDDTIPPQVEYMYVKALDFLKREQKENGTFDGTYGDDPAAAAFCLMAVLAHGEDPVSGPYSELVQRSLDFILSSQSSENGMIGSTMYSHGFATLALAEAYGAIPDDRLGPSLQKAVALSLKAQSVNPLGAWRYDPTSTDADTSVTGCILVSLHAAANAGIEVPHKALDKGLQFMASCRDSKGIYGYTSPGSGSIAVSAIGLLTQALAKKHEEPSFQATLAFLKSKLQTREDTYPYYMEYYMAQALFHADEEIWRAWNRRNFRLMAASQAPDGSWSGMRSPGYSTAFALLSLAVNYRFLPIYEK